MLYDGLEDLLSHAKSLGMLTTVTTNGYLLDAKRLDRLSGRLDLLALSLDGPPALHNAIRGSTRAFQRMARGLVNVRSIGIKFGFIHTLTRHTWQHLLWIAAFAARNKASLLQIHPLELSGRAADKMCTDAIDFGVSGRAYLIAMALIDKYGESMHIQIDLLHRNSATSNPELVYASNLDASSDSIAPATLMKVIVLQADGTVVPVSYGFNRRFEICNVNKRRLADAWPSYLTHGYRDFVHICREEYNAICAGEVPLLFNWHERIVARSNEIGTYIPVESVILPASRHSVGRPR
ncbi:MoaA/NifB/PqqE/SkfB family radical SAM enzyme [Paraburkholderia sp. Clong3]